MSRVNRRPLAATTAATPTRRAVLLPQHRQHVVRLSGRGRCPLPLITLLTRTYTSRAAAVAAVANYRAAGIPTYRLAVLPLGV